MPNNFRINFVESVRGWGQKHETYHYKTAQEAVDAYFRTNDSLPDRVNGFAPDYYFQALSVEGFDEHTGECYFIDPYKYRNEQGLTKTKESSKTVVETKPQETTVNNKIEAWSNDHLGLVEFLSEKAKTLRSDAGHSGSQTDYGAGALEAEIAAWTAGITGTIPKHWIPYLNEYQKKSDPEYQTYLKLKEKFGE